MDEEDAREMGYYAISVGKVMVRSPIGLDGIDCADFTVGTLAQIFPGRELSH